jgi:hypothetical protein
LADRQLAMISEQPCRKFLSRCPQLYFDKGGASGHRNRDRPPSCWYEWFTGSRFRCMNGLVRSLGAPTESSPKEGGRHPAPTSARSNSSAGATAQPTGLGDWFAELKRRRIFRAIVGYGIAA